MAGPCCIRRRSIPNNRRWSPLDSGFEVTAGISVTPGTPSRFDTPADAHQRRGNATPRRWWRSIAHLESGDPFTADCAWNRHRADGSQRAASAHLELIHDAVRARLDVEELLVRRNRRVDRTRDRSASHPLARVLPRTAVPGIG